VSPDLVLLLLIAIAGWCRAHWERQQEIKKQWSDLNLGRMHGWTPRD